MGGSIEWCGVNYLENRGEFDLAQFLSNSLFRYNELPEPTDETIPGDWRYPTKQELQELAETCNVTMIDFNENFARLTNGDGNNIYIPFTLEKKIDAWTYGSHKLMLMPADDGESGLCIWTTDMNISDMGSKDRVKCGEDLTKYTLGIVNRSPHNKNDESYHDFFHWSYIDGTGGNSQRKHGEEKRGVRFVCNK